MFGLFKKREPKHVHDEELDSFREGLTTWDEYEFDPRPDINAFDLARLIQVEAAVAPGLIYLNPDEPPEWWADDALNRHFKKTGRTARDVYDELEGYDENAADGNDAGC